MTKFLGLRLPSAWSLAIFATFLAIGSSAAQSAAPGRRTVLVDGHANELVKVGGVEVREGEIYVAQPQLATILVFGNNGTLLRKIGGPGEGPGEFRHVEAIGFVGDTLWAYDRSLRRLSLFARSGRPLKSVTVQGDNLSAMATPLLVAVTSAGGLVVRFMLHTVGGQFPAQSPLDLILPGGKVVNLGQIQHTPVTFVTPSGSGTFVTYLYADLFANGPLIATSDTTIITGRTDAQSGHLELTAFSTDGRKKATVSYTFPTVSVPGLMRDSVRERLTAGLKFLAPGADHGRFIQDRIPIPGVFPLLKTLVMGDDGRVWTESISIGGQRTIWRRLSPGGIAEDMFTTPRSFRGLLVRANRVWGIELDADDVPSIVVYGAAGPP